jgi:hypothetical protein
MSDAGIAGVNAGDTAAESWALVDELPEMEREFVIGILKGRSVEESAERAGWRTELGLVRALGRPRVKAALEQLAPLVMEPKEAARLLARYWMARLVATASTGSDAQAISAVKELSSLAGYNVSRSEVLHATLGDALRALDGRNPPTQKALPQATIVDAEVCEPEPTDSQSVQRKRRLGTRLPPGKLKPKGQG